MIAMRGPHRMNVLMAMRGPHRMNVLIDAGSPQNERADGDAGSPQNERADGDAGSPQNERADGDAGSPQNERADGDAGSPQNEHAGLVQHLQEISPSLQLLLILKLIPKRAPARQHSPLLAINKQTNSRMMLNHIFFKKFRLISIALRRLVNWIKNKLVL